VKDSIEQWRERARREETPRQTAIATQALNAAPSAESLRDLAACAALAKGLDPEKVATLIRWGLAQKSDKLNWDAVHAAAELAGADLGPDLRGVLDSPKRFAESVRGRAAEAYAEASPKEAVELLDVLRTKDKAWTVRRLSTDSLRHVRSELSQRGGLFSRLKALMRCGLIRFEADEEPLEVKALGKLGLRVPAIYMAFFVDVFPGGRLVYVDRSKSEESDGESCFLTTPNKLGLQAATLPADLVNANEYVWARYIDGSRTYPQQDEDYALKRYAEFYDRRANVDADSYNYGVLLFEAAFRDDANRETYLLRCRNVLSAYCRLTGGEEWDVVDDRLAEAEDLIAEEKLGWSKRTCECPIALGHWMGLAELRIDNEAPGVFAHDADESPSDWRVAPTMGVFLNAPTIARPDAEAPPDPLEQLAIVGVHMDAGRRREAARMFCDVLEANTGNEAVVNCAASLLAREDITALAAAQLLSMIPLQGDRKSMTLVRAVLVALPEDVGTSFVEAAAPYNEDGSQIALFVDAAAGIRKRSHGGLKKVAKALREGRAKQHIRTLKNPWYKK
jgi:hypothetical protein